MKQSVTAPPPAMFAIFASDRMAHYQNRTNYSAAMSIRLTNSGYLGDPELDALRTKADDLIRIEDWAGLLALRTQLEQDTTFWTDWWGPSCALAARLTSQPEAAALLAELVQAGFNQPEIFSGELEDAFADDPRWPAISHAMTTASTPIPIALTTWPTLTPSAPLSLFELTGRAGELRELLPLPSPSAWETARAMLAWATTRWPHANAHMEINDAVECLRRVDEGARFACIEYSLVLSQALNALCIPSRRVSLRQAGYHTGYARGHVVSEAWIDDLNRWVVLDGQNGIYWVGEDGGPLGAVELQRLSQAGGPRPNFVPLVADLSAIDADLWFSYFAHVTTTAGTWSQEPLGLVFQRIEMNRAKRVEHRPDALYPDLSELGIETLLRGDQPAVRLITAHPFARGFTTDGARLESDTFTLDSTPGTHEHALAARTDYGTLHSQALRYTVTHR